MATKVLLDANVLLEYVLKRENYEKVKTIFELEGRHKVKLFISCSILHIVGHFLSKSYGVLIAKATMKQMLNHVKVVGGSDESSLKALESDFTDIEDALQYYTALLHKMDYVVSFDKGFLKFNSDKLPIIDAQTMVALFKS